MMGIENDTKALEMMLRNILTPFVSIDGDTALRDDLARSLTEFIILQKHWLIDGGLADEENHAMRTGIAYLVGRDTWSDIGGFFKQ
jgi:hypothetical protein